MTNLTLDKCGDDWDWYALHRDGRGLQWASIEGDAAEWLAIADHIERGLSIMVFGRYVHGQNNLGYVVTDAGVAEFVGSDGATPYTPIVEDWMP